MNDSGIGARRALIPRYNPKRAAAVAAGALAVGWILGVAAVYVGLVYVAGD